MNSARSALLDRTTISSMIERFTTKASQNYSLLLYPDGDDDLQYIYEKRY